MQSFLHQGEKLKCAIYTRVSTGKQKSDGYGLESQLASCEAMALIKGWTIVQRYEDEISGTIKPMDRPDMSRLIEDAQNGKFQAVIFYSLDRIGRTHHIVINTIKYLDSISIKVVSCRESIDTSTAAGLFVITIFSALAELERDNIISRTIAGKKVRIDKDGECGGDLPYGYSRLDRKVIINDSQANIVKYIYESRYKKITLTKIVQALNNKDIPAPKSDKWNMTTIHKILSRKDVYMGGFRNGSHMSWPQILPEEYRNVVFVKKRTKKVKHIDGQERKRKQQNVDMSLFTKNT